MAQLLCHSIQEGKNQFLFVSGMIGNCVHFPVVSLSYAFFLILIFLNFFFNARSNSKSIDLHHLRIICLWLLPALLPSSLSIIQTNHHPSYRVLTILPNWPILPKKPTQVYNLWLNSSSAHIAERANIAEIAWRYYVLIINNFECIINDVINQI